MISTRQAAAALVLPLVLLASGCELLGDLTTSPPVSPSPAPTATNTGPVAEQMDQDYAAAEKAYRANVGEINRLFQQGGATKPSAVLKATSNGPWLKTTMELQKQVHGMGWKQKGGTKIVGVSQTGWKPNELFLSGCEDVSGISLFKGTKDVSPKHSNYYLQKITARKTGTTWRLYDATTVKLKSLEGQECAG